LRAEVNGELAVRNTRLVEKRSDIGFQLRVKERSGVKAIVRVILMALISFFQLESPFAAVIMECFN